MLGFNCIYPATNQEVWFLREIIFAQINCSKFFVSEPTLETQQAAGLIGDAEKCKLLLPSLHDTTARRDENCPIRAKLQQLSSELNNFLIGESQNF